MCKYRKQKQYEKKGGTRDEKGGEREIDTQAEDSISETRLLLPYYLPVLDHNQPLVPRKTQQWCSPVAHWQTLHPQMPPQPSLTWCPFLWPLSRVDNGDSRLPPSMLVYRTCRRNRAVTTTGVRYTDLVLEVSEVVQIFSPVVAEGRKKKQMRQKWFRTLPDFQWW